MKKRKWNGLLALALISILPSFLWSESGMPKENYEKKFLFDLKIEKSSFGNLFVDAQENYFVLQSSAPNVLIEIFNKKGNFVRKIIWKSPDPEFAYDLRVDEDGNILLFEEARHTGFVLDNSGKLISKFKVGELFSYEFSQGVVYQVTDGKILFKLPTAKSGPKQSKYFKEFDESYDIDKMRKENSNLNFHEKHHIHLPATIGEFFEDGVWAVTNDGASYVYYSTNPVVKPGYTFQNPYQRHELVKFDSKYHLIGVIPVSHHLLINLETGNLYDPLDQHENGILKIYRWEKIS